ncbi:MAG: hypothetical protein ACNA78_03885 [Balneolaceae bacterium]
MNFHYHINIQYKSRERRLLNAVLAIVTGVLTLLYPSFLYLIAGGYLMALGILFLLFRMPVFLAAFPIVAGMLIFIFPDLIPFTFAGFMALFGLLMVVSLGFVVVGIITLILAFLIFSNPDSVAYFIAAFLLLYGVSNLIKGIRDQRPQGPGRYPEKPRDPNEIVIEQ